MFIYYLIVFALFGIIENMKSDIVSVHQIIFPHVRHCAGKVLVNTSGAEAITRIF